jgi:PIN domain nuclease of toxin-antitoxin system
MLVLDTHVLVWLDEGNPRLGTNALQIELDVWRIELLQNGLLEIPLQGSTALRAGQLQAFHGDPADRMIVATALENSAILVTADKKILDWDKLHQKIDAFL